MISVKVINMVVIKLRLDVCKLNMFELSVKVIVKWYSIELIMIVMIVI